MFPTTTEKTGKHWNEEKHWCETGQDYYTFFLIGDTQQNFPQTYSRSFCQCINKRLKIQLSFTCISWVADALELGTKFNTLAIYTWNVLAIVYLNITSASFPSFGTIAFERTKHIYAISIGAQRRILALIDILKRSNELK